MPANDGRHHYITNRARVGTFSACAAAVIALALGACTSTATTPATNTAATAIPSGGPGILTGAGSTYVAPFFALAFAKYHQQHPAVTVNYASWAAAQASPRSAPGRSTSAPPTCP